MAWLQTSYTTRFNVRHRRSGHLFQGRFKAQLVDADEYARWLVEYVHLNPVRPRKKGEPLAPQRAGELDRHRWSSHRDYAGLRKKSTEWLCLDWLAHWGRSRRQAQVEYRKAVHQAFGRPASDPWQRLRRGLVLGGEELYQKAQALMEKKGRLEEARWTQTEEMARVRKRVKKLVESETEDRIKIWARVRLGEERGIEVAREYGYRDGSGITQVVKRLEARALNEKSIWRKLEELRKLSIVKV
jgi:hypothetical protein